MPGLTAGATVRTEADVPADTDVPADIGELPPDLVSWLDQAPPAARPRVAFVLWDIADLLPGSAELDAAAHRAAFRAVTGRPLSPPPFLEAGTDPRIALNLLVSAGIPRDRAVRLLPQLLPELVAAARRMLSAAFPSVLDRPPGPDRPLPGPGLLAGPDRQTRMLLDGVAEGGALQSVISRNLRRVALVKLAAAGLENRLDAGIGAYGSDDARLDRLVPVACARAARRHRAIVDPAGTVVVTSSPASAVAAWRAGAGVVYPRADCLLMWGRGIGGHPRSQNPTARLERLAYH